jgi:hypothetical protein
MPTKDMLTTSFIAVAVVMLASITTSSYAVYYAMGQTDGSNTNSNQKVSKKDLKELAKCETDLTNDDGQLTLADVRDCYSQIFPNSSQAPTPSSQPPSSAMTPTQQPPA